MLWEENFQTLVDAAYVAESFLRGYDALWLPLDSITKQRYIEEFTSLRRINRFIQTGSYLPPPLKFFLRKADAKPDMYRINSTLRKIDEWYVGDGWYSDGPGFAFDYYNSFALHPMYFEALDELTESGRKRKEWAGL